MNKVLNFLSQYRTLTHFIALGIVGAAGWVAKHPNEIIAAAQYIQAHQTQSISALAGSLLLTLYHGSKAN